MSIAKEFREFAVKGNVMDLAVGVIVGAAFGKIVSSLVEDVVMPVIGALMGGLDFSGLAVKIGSATLKYGKFLQTCVDFLIIAWAIRKGFWFTDGGLEFALAWLMLLVAQVLLGDGAYAVKVPRLPLPWERA